jgi:uncharacterized membrane protein (UPF0127 family)
MKAFNSRNGKEVSADVKVAESLPKRLKGLLGRKELKRGESLWIRPCKGIHTIGMGFPIDVVFLNKRNVVISVKQNFPPNRMTRFYFSAVSVLELTAGTLTATDTRVGDRIDIG